MAGFFDFYRDLLEHEPRMPYYAQLYGQPTSPNQQRYFQNNYSDIYNEYLGALGQQIQGGQAPTLRWTQFLAQQPFADRFQSLTPEQRGENMAQFNPRTRWVF